MHTISKELRLWLKNFTFLNEGFVCAHVSASTISDETTWFGAGVSMLYGCGRHFNRRMGNSFASRRKQVLARTNSICQIVLCYAYIRSQFLQQLCMFTNSTSHAIVDQLNRQFHVVPSPFKSAILRSNSRAIRASEVNFHAWFCKLRVCRVKVRKPIGGANDSYLPVGITLYCSTLDIPIHMPKAACRWCMDGWKDHNGDGG